MPFLKNSFICQDCEWIGEQGASCEKCASEVVHLLSTWLNRAMITNTLVDNGLAKLVWEKGDVSLVDAGPLRFDENISAERMKEIEEVFARSMKNQRMILMATGEPDGPQAH